jgi:putative flavoprotein involved in K+ transport
VTGAGGGHDIDLRRFAADGMTLLGRLSGFSDGKLHIAADLEVNLAQGEAWFASLRKRMDEYAEKNGMPASVDIVAEEPAHVLPPWSQPVTELDPTSAGITSVVWCSGFRYDFGWVKLPILDDAGEPLHERGVTQYRGLYFVGLRRTYAISSALLAGVGNDAAFIAEHIASRTAAATTPIKSGQALSPYER